MAKDISKEAIEQKVGSAAVQSYGGDSLKPIKTTGAIKVDCNKQ